MALVLWFAGLVGIVIAAAVASGRGRSSPHEVAGRGVIVASAIAYAAVVAGAVWLWGAATAREGRAARIREGATVTVTVDGVRAPLDRVVTIGHAPTASIHVPGTGPDELARIELEPTGAASVRGGAIVVPVPAGESAATLAKARGCVPDAAATRHALPPGGAIAVVECEGDRIVRALVVRREGGLVLVPLAMHQGRLVPEHRTLAAGDALRIGSATEPIPGLVTWEVASPNRAVAMLAIPRDPVDCGAWSGDAPRAVGQTCEVRAGTFALVVRPFVPDADAVQAVDVEAALVIGVPPILVLVALALSRRRGRRVHALGRALRLCALAGGLVALACWRMLWAHRIDAMRDVATRLADNRFQVIAMGATIAAVAVLALPGLEGRSPARRAIAAIAGWCAWLCAAMLLLEPTWQVGGTTVGILGLSLVAALVPVLAEVGGSRARIAPELVLAAIALCAALARHGAPGGVLAKLALAYGTVLAGHAALRAMLVPATRWWRRGVLAATLVGAAGTVAMLDAGVALAIVGFGLAIAMLVAGHDAMYDASQAGRIGVLEREHARVLVVHGAATVALAIGVAVAAVVASDRGLLEYGALGVLHAPLVAAVLFGLAAIVARSHRRSWAPWVVAALATLAVWGMRERILERVTAGDGVGARRVAAVIDPGYALLRDDHAFVANATAWREAALATPHTDAWRGQGYFAAQIRDPGVTHSIDNDYLPVLVAREAGVGGLMQTVLLLLVIVVGAGAIANVRTRHASREHRARWLVTSVAGTLAVYQPLAALGVLPLTGISWPGLGIDSPADLWLFVIGATWCLLAGDDPAPVPVRARTEPAREDADDSRVRSTPRVVRARRVVLAALVVAGVAAVAIVARAGAFALARATDDDARVSSAIRYAGSLACATPETAAPSVDEALPGLVAGKPTDGGTTRYERELQSLWRAQRALLVEALAGKSAPVSLSSPQDTGIVSVADPPSARDDPTASKPTDRPTDRQARTGGRTNGNRPDDDRARGRGNSAGDDRAPARTGAREKGRRRTGDDRARARTETASRRRPADQRARAREEDEHEPDRDRRSRRTSGARGAQVKESDRTADDGPSSDAPGDALDRVLGAFHWGDGAAPLPCPPRVGAWRLAPEGGVCVATLSAGWPEVKLALQRTPEGIHARCSVALADDAIGALRARNTTPRPRIRVVSAPLGAAADDLGELALGDRIVRLRVGAPERSLDTLPPGLHVAGKLSIGPEANAATVAVRPSPRGIAVTDAAELYITDPEGAWRPIIQRAPVVLDRMTLIVAGPPDRRVVVLFRPPRVWPGPKPGAPVVDTLLADTGDRARRVYPYGAALPELGWVNPYDVDRSLGLDGWIHAALAHPGDGARPACGTLAPPAIARDRVCSPSPLDGVVECRVALQPELALALRALADTMLAEPKAYTGRTTHPVRAAYVVLRGDTGEILAQGNRVPGRPELAYAPADAAADAELRRLRDEPGEADAERVDWNLPIAVGSTFKPVVARAAEQAFPDQAGTLTLTAAGSATGCRRRRGKAVAPIAGHCPPTSVAGHPTTADIHEFLARSPNWFQAALGVIGLGLPDAQLTVNDERVTFAAVVGSDLATWPADKPLGIADGAGPIVARRGLSIDGLRRTPLWTRVEALLGRPICTLGDRASCERAGSRADVCAARALPIAGAGADLRNLVALGPDRIDLHADDRPHQTTVPMREYFQLLRGSGFHAVGSLAQITDAFGRVVYDPTPEAPVLAASWFPAPVTGVVPAWSCARSTGRANTVLGADGGLCGVVRPGGTAAAAFTDLLADPTVVVYGGKSGTIDSLADIARSKRACRRWNATHVAASQLECGRAPLDDSLFVIAFGVVTPRGTIPITLGLQLQRAGKGAASKATPAFVRAIAAYLRG